MYYIMNFFHCSLCWAEAFANPYPGQSTSWQSSPGTLRKWRCCVLPGVLEHLTTFWPKIAFKSVLLPTLLLPTKAISLCSARRGSSCWAYKYYPRFERSQAVSKLPSCTAISQDLNRGVRDEYFGSRNCLFSGSTMLIYGVGSLSVFTIFLFFTFVCF